MFFEEEEETNGQGEQGQEQEQQEGATEQAVGEQEQEKEQTEGQQQEENAAPDPNLIDPDDGKTWKSKAKEHERKYNALLEKVMASAEQKTGQQQAGQDENEEIPATRGGVKQVLSELQREERLADQVFEEAVDELIVENPGFAPFKEELRGMVKTLNDMNARKNPDTVKLIAKGLWGTKNWKPAPAAPKPVKKFVSSKQSDVLPPSQKSGAGSEPELTEAEQEYAEHHRFFGTFNNEEIKDMYRKANGKKNDKGG